MVGISDYRPAGVPPGTIELRVHGVSGTPPEALLKDTAVLVAGTATAGFHRHSPSGRRMTDASPGVREGYAWGGLTSGTRIASALRLLLLPFSLVNVAGWMAPGVDGDDGLGPTCPNEPLAEESRRRIAVHTLVSRLLALALTVFSALSATWLAFVSAVGLNARFSIPLLSTTGEQARAAMAAVALLVALWAVVARRRARVPSALAVDADVAAAVAGSPVMGMTREGFDVSMLWRVPSAQGHLSRVHAGAALGASALATAAVLVPTEPLLRGPQWLAAVALLAAAIGPLALASPRLGKTRSTGVITASALALGIAAVAWVALSESDESLIDGALVTADRFLAAGVVWIAAVVFVLIALQYLTGTRGGPAIGRFYAPAFAVIGFAAAFTGVAGLAGIVSRVLPETSLSGFAVAMAQLVAMVGVLAGGVVAVIALLQLDVTRSLSSVAGFGRIRSTIAHVRGAIVAGAAVFAIGANAVAVWVAVTLWSDPHAELTAERGQWTAIGWCVVTAVLGAVFAARARRWPLRVGWTLVAAAAPVAVWLALAPIADATDASWLDSLATSVKDGAAQWFVVVAVTTVAVAPVAAILAYMSRGSKDQSTRRSVGVVWDLVAFWPRQFHPWAPPPYTDTTIPELADRIRTLAQESGAGRIVVSAHSQGAIIAIPAIMRLKDDIARGVMTTEDASRVSLLTYGQLLDTHYRWLFPWIFNPGLFAQVDAFVSTRWINLYRVTDPLGHSVRAVHNADPERDIRIEEGLELDTGATSKRKTLNHGDYWYSSAVYASALRKLGAPPTPSRRSRWLRRGASSGTDPRPRP